ncbi:MAG: YlcI/YnfO family protein [Mariprofundaceae bacterium]|nr:YlcI/YnfO family protein [Mariprofundaceae bacterium]
MKTATIPSFRVDPELRQTAENMLHKGETLSGFVEQSLRANIKRRQLHDEFIARGLASRDEALKSGKYFDADNVLCDLKDMLSDAVVK